MHRCYSSNATILLRAKNARVHCKCGSLQAPRVTSEPHYIHVIADAMKLLWTEKSRDAISTLLARIHRGFMRPLQARTYVACMNHKKAALDDSNISDTGMSKCTSKLCEDWCMNSHFP